MGCLCVGVVHAGADATSEPAVCPSGLPMFSQVMLRPASDGTGVIAGGAVRTVLELAGVKNAFGKQLGSANPLNNARATLVGLDYMRTPKDVAAARDLSAEEMIERIKSGELGSPETLEGPVDIALWKETDGRELLPHSHYL